MDPLKVATSCAARVWLPSLNCSHMQFVDENDKMLENWQKKLKCKFPTR